jgi:hypothetical protein
MRPQSKLRARSSLAVGALCIAMTAVGAAPAPTSADSQGAPQSIALKKRRLNVRAGSTAMVAGAVRPNRRGVRVLLQVRGPGGRWLTVARDRTRRGGRFSLRVRRTRPGSHVVRLRAGEGRVAKRTLGRLNAFRSSVASWYGPGLYGGRLACGGRLTPGTLGVANKSLPCGTRVTIRHRGRAVRVPVVDRGPFVGGREWDLTAATARRLGFRGHGTVWVTR